MGAAMARAQVSGSKESEGGQYILSRGGVGGGCDTREPGAPWKRTPCGKYRGSRAAGGRGRLSGRQEGQVGQ
eukprot:7163036-Prymnesium_polylepis.1